MVCTIYKNKGPVHICDNYRPISLLCVAYKVVANLLLKRLQNAGAEDRLDATQFGFCRGRGTADAIHMVRRHIEVSNIGRNCGSTFVALDWKKAFDSINVDAMLAALGRCGLPTRILAIIKNIYTNRKFCVMDGGHKSKEKPQHSGIAQGCPLSPFLFVMVMTVVMYDAVELLGEQS